MKCFVAQLKPFDPEDRSGETVARFQDESITAGICGMGWSDPEMFSSLGNNNSIQAYREAFISENRKRDPQWSSRTFSAAINIYDEIRTGDFILTRLYKSSECYVGKVLSEAYFNNNRLSFAHGAKYSWMVNVDWKPIGYFLNIPNSLRGIMQGRMGTIKRIPINAPQTKLIANIFLGNMKKITLDNENFHYSLDALDLEDLVSQYIIMQNPSYTL